MANFELLKKYLDLLEKAYIRRIGYCTYEPSENALLFFSAEHLKRKKENRIDTIDRAIKRLQQRCMNLCKNI